MAATAGAGKATPAVAAVTDSLRVQVLRERVERLGEIRNEIVDVLDADRDTD